MPKESRSLRKARLVTVKGRAADPIRPIAAINTAMKEARESGISENKVQRVAAAGSKIRKKAAAGNTRAKAKQASLQAKRGSARDIVDMAKKNGKK